MGNDMNSSVNFTPERKVTNNDLDWVGAQLESKIDGDRDLTESPMVSDIGSPYGSPATSQYSDCLDFGEADADLI